MKKGKKNGGLFINGVRGLGFYLKWPIVSVIKHLPSPISFFIIIKFDWENVFCKSVWFSYMFFEIICYYIAVEIDKLDKCFLR